MFISGQLPILDGTVKYTGRIGAELTIQHGYDAARLCGLNLLAHARDVCAGDWGRFKKVVKLGGFVQCAPHFTDQPKVLNGASDLMMDVFGEVGRHARIAVGVAALPLGAAVEIDGVFQIV